MLVRAKAGPGCFGDGEHFTRNAIPAHWIDPRASPDSCPAARPRTVNDTDDGEQEVPVPDFRNSRRARRQNWFGRKKYVKAVLSLPGAHLPMRVLAPQVPAV